MGHAKPPSRPAPGGKPSDAFDARLDRALASWPAPRAGVDWTAKAGDTARSATAAPRPERPSDADLMRPPLPATALEGGRQRVRLWLMAGGLAATTAAAVAAGALLFAARAPVQAGGAVAAVSATPSPAGVRAGLRPSTASRPVEPAGSDTPGVDPKDLPLVQAAAARPQAPAPLAARSVASPRPPAAEPAPSALAGQAEPDPLPYDSLQPAAAAGSVPIPPGAGTPWNVPRRPPVGAIQAAFATVLPAARACLGPGDPASRAVVTFRSDGTVQDVSLPARTASAEGCVRAALEKARVPPFAEGTYSAPVTVRY
jgi:hypothetical protein